MLRTNLAYSALCVLAFAACAKATSKFDPSSTSSVTTGQGPAGSTTSGGGDAASTTATTSGGQGGDDSSTATTGEGGAGGSGDTTTATTGQGGAGGGGMSNCDVCKEGPALNANCSKCAAAVCKEDSYCCTNKWDKTCVDETKDYCENNPCNLGSGGAGGGGTGGGGSGGSGGGGGACDHDVCTQGGPLLTSCSPCAAAVCKADPYCCSSKWDGICVGEVKQYCMPNPCAMGSTVKPGDLLITEIMNNPAKVADDKGEWFEIYNTTASPIDLKGLVIRHQLVAVDAKAVEAISKSVMVPAKGFVVLGNNADSNTNGGVKVDYQYSVKVVLNNSKDYLAIETADASPVKIDETTYDMAKLMTDGKSRSLDPASMSMLANDDDTNFCAAKTLIMNSTDYGTPGKANDKCM